MRRIFLLGLIVSMLTLSILSAASETTFFDKDDDIKEWSSTEFVWATVSGYEYYSPEGLRIVPGSTDHHVWYQGAEVPWKYYYDDPQWRYSYTKAKYVHYGETGYVYARIP
ncbi:MAG: hypothetical protein J7K57_02510 [Palaeococcus sp.]|uniref:hypothetical protein n=1 Tax=Palaeococcus sp. (in: euryarchaeotes) TaxID=2820298 RepID=UPI0025CE12A3|nr:hypothetical protein [Palaeococcus sp. (in: euryarchaeotes)]MCD6558738.1 hypothetical protein [Palaeococcus sp. (in: euryarchaeotes)]